MTSPTQWTWVWVNSGSWWWTGRPGVLQAMGLQRVGHDWVTELKAVQRLSSQSRSAYSDTSEAHWFDDFLDRLLVTLLPPVAGKDMSNLVTSLQIRDTYRSQRWPISQIYNLCEETRKKQYQRGKVIQIAKTNKNSFFFLSWNEIGNSMIGSHISK